MKSLKHKKKAGFTLVELMVVAAIIAILAAIIIPLLAQNKMSAVASEGQNIMGALMTGAKTQYARTGTWPGSVLLLDDEELKEDAKKTKNWTVSDATKLGTRSTQVITLPVKTTSGYSGTLTLTGNIWSGTFDFAKITP